jgi:hypothetical protein
MGGACGTHGGNINAYRILVRKPEWKIHVGDGGVDRSIVQ